MGSKITARKLTSTKDMDRETWLKHRKTGIGGSDVGAACGASPWSDQLTLWLDRTGRSDRKFTAEAEERMRWGNILETPIAEEFAARHPNLRMERRNAIYQHKTIDWALANVDRVLQSEIDKSWGILEVKTVGEFAFRSGDWSENEVPPAYYLQVMHYLWVLDLDWAYVAFLVGGQQYYDIFIPRDEETIAGMAKALATFWNYVEDDREPPAGACSSEALNSLYPIESDENPIDMSHDVLLVHNLKSAKDSLKQAQDRVKESENAFKQVMGEHDTAIMDGKKIATWKTQTRKGFDKKGLAEAHPDIASEYMTETSSRTFRFTAK